MSDERAPYETEVVDMQVSIEVGERRILKTYDFAENIAKLANDYYKSGSDLVSIIPIINGDWEFDKDTEQTETFSYTESVVMVFKERDA